MRPLALGRFDRLLPRNLRTAGAGVFVAAVVLVGVAQTAVGTSLARSIGLAAPAERFTELFFSDDQKISSLTEGDVPVARNQTVSFVIANHESRRMTYRWQVRSAGLKRASGEFTLDPGAKQEVSTGTPIPTGCRFRVIAPTRAKLTKEADASNRAPKLLSIGPTKSQITVMLAKPDDAISYWVACRA